MTSRTVSFLEDPARNRSDAKNPVKRVGNRLVIDLVQIGDRPPGLFGGRPMSHTVAWEAFCDVLRYGIMGKTLDEALNRVFMLYLLALDMASMTRDDLLPPAGALALSLAPRLLRRPSAQEYGSQSSSGSNGTGRGRPGGSYPAS
jgi:hypothetical protein